MPPLLHDPAMRDEIRARVQKLRPDTPRKWGKMSVDQMLHHLNVALENALDEVRPARMRIPLPRSVFKWVVFNLPWPKGSPTAPEFIAGERYDFAAEHARCLELLDRISAKDMESSGWGRSPGFGQLNGRDWSRLSAKHVLHHLNQFGV